MRIEPALNAKRRLAGVLQRNARLSLREPRRIAEHRPDGHKLAAAQRIGKGPRGRGHHIHIMDGVDLQIGETRPVVGHAHPDELIELPEVGAVEAVAAARGGQDEIVAPVAVIVGVGVVVSGENRVAARRQHLLDALPSLGHLAIRPKRLMQKDESPPRIGIGRERLFQPRHLLIADVVVLRPIGTQNHKQRALVGETVERLPEPRDPLLLLVLLQNIVVSGSAEERRLEPIGNRAKLLPLRVDLRGVLGVARASDRRRT